MLQCSKEKSEISHKTYEGKHIKLTSRKEVYTLIITKLAGIVGLFFICEQRQFLLVTVSIDNDACVKRMTCTASTALNCVKVPRTLLYISSWCKQAHQFGDEHSIVWYFRVDINVVALYMEQLYGNCMLSVHFLYFGILNLSLSLFNTHELSCLLQWIHQNKLNLPEFSYANLFLEQNGSGISFP